MASLLKAFDFNCSLKSSKASEKSSTDVLLRQFFDALRRHGVDGEFVRATDFNIKPGVKSDERIIGNALRRSITWNRI
jgi:hypothetical protein